MQPINGEIANNVWSTRIQHTVPALIFLTPYIHFEIGPKVSLEGSSALSAGVIITALAFVFSYLTELVGDYVYESIVCISNSKRDRFFLNTNRRKLSFDTVLDLKVNRYRERAKVLSALIFPSASTYACFTVHNDVTIPYIVDIAVVTWFGFLFFRTVSYIRRYVVVLRHFV